MAEPTPENVIPNPDLREILQRLTTALNDLKPFLALSSDGTPRVEIPAAQQAHPHPNPTPAPAGGNSIRAAREPSIVDIFRRHAPTSDRLSELLQSYGSNICLELLRFPRRDQAGIRTPFDHWGVTAEDNIKKLWPKMFGTLAVDGGAFTWNENPSRPESSAMCRGAAHGLDPDGYPTRAMVLDGETHSSSQVSAALLPIEHPAQGKVWVLSIPTFSLEIRVISLSETVFLCHILHSYLVLASDNERRIQDFLTSFVLNGHNKKFTESTANVLRAPLEAAEPWAPVVALQFHVRHLAPQRLWHFRHRIHLPFDRPVHVQSPGSMIVSLARTNVKMGERFGGQGLTEGRSSTALTLVLTEQAPYNIVAVIDNCYPFYPDQISGLGEQGSIPRREIFADRSMWESYGILPCGRCTGVAQFLAMVASTIIIWEQQWMEALDDIDEVVSVNLSDSLDDVKWNSFMFDDSFQRSRMYFTVLETLRISGDWVDEVPKTSKRLRQQWNDNVEPTKIFDEADWRALDKGWDAVERMITDRAMLLRDRINGKTEEVKSLRDGLFNATSLREASKGIELNRAVYVFTVITVIFTPISFMATFWALPFVSSSSDGSNTGVPNGFKTSFIVVPVLTYVASMVLALYFHNRSRRMIVGFLEEILRWTGGIWWNIFYYALRLRLALFGRGGLLRWYNRRA
ncbi:hypothetical protein B0T19DRAFT_416990 [Cercophora scortea]|uniref:Uncharacterized protein n=1 Tax=Cercophora scortea TaxID=314031 RepID=A0AAE0MJ65_9PEZI|nr:hypothetical protein B0T19DRAFT_416990 [Cercophora scortea]